MARVGAMSNTDWRSATIIIMLGVAYAIQHFLGVGIPDIG